MSFSQEMKDFIGAYQSGQKIMASKTDEEYKKVRTEAERLKTERDNDPDTLATAKQQAQATLAATTSRMNNDTARVGQEAIRTGIAGRTADANIAATNARAGLYDAQKGVYTTAAPGTGLYPPGAIQPGAAPGTAPAPAAGVLPIGPSTLNPDPDAYAEGGLVEGDDEGDGDDEEGVLDTAEVPTPAQAPTDVSAQSRTRPVQGVNGIVSPQLVEDARHAGMTFGIQQAGLHQPGAVKTPAAMLKAKQIAQGVGGLSEQEMQAARQAVDPEGKLTDSQRNLAALGSVYQFWANKGEPEKAQRVAFQMLQYYRGAAQRYAAIAAKAAEGGNIDLATKAALKAYANVPDGRDISIDMDPDGKGLVYYYTDDKGNEIAKGIATPQQLAASAMGLATGGFDKALLSAAGAMQDAGAGKKPAAGKTQSSSDRAKEAESVGGEIEKLKSAWQAKNKDKPLDEEQWNEVGNIAQHIYQQNPKATANEVARAAHAMLVPGDTAVPEDKPFKVKPGEDGKPNVIDFGGKLRIELDDNQLDSILNSRAVRVKAAVDKMNKDVEDSEKPGFMDKAGTATSNIGGIIADDASKFGKEMGEVGERIKGALPEELVIRGGSALKAAGRAISDGLARIKDIDQATTPKQLPKTIERLVRAGIAAVKPEDKGAIPVDEAEVP